MLFMANWRDVCYYVFQTALLRSHPVTGKSEGT